MTMPELVAFAQTELIKKFEDAQRVITQDTMSKLEYDLSYITEPTIPTPMKYTDLVRIEGEKSIQLNMKQNAGNELVVKKINERKVLLVVVCGSFDYDIPFYVPAMTGNNTTVPEWVLTHIKNVLKSIGLIELSPRVLSCTHKESTEMNIINIINSCLMLAELDSSNGMNTCGEKDDNKSDNELSVSVDDVKQRKQNNVHSVERNIMTTIGKPVLSNDVEKGIIVTIGKPVLPNETESGSTTMGVQNYPTTVQPRLNLLNPATPMIIPMITPILNLMTNLSINQQMSW